MESNEQNGLANKIETVIDPATSLTAIRGGRAVGRLGEKGEWVKQMKIKLTDNNIVITRGKGKSGEVEEGNGDKW